MRISPSLKLSFAISAIIALTFSLIYTIVDTFFIKSHWKYLLILTTSVFLIALPIIHVFFKQFLYKRIKFIYNSMRPKSSDLQDHELKKAINNPQFLEEAGDRVIQWAQEKSIEVEELKKQEKFRRDFIGNLSHELKTPLFNVQGYILTLLDGGLSDNSINTEYLKRAEKNVDRLITITTDLETIARLESGEEKLKITRFNLSDLIAEVLESYEITANTKNIKLVYDPTSDYQLYVLADREKIHHVFNNLIENSIKYGKTNGQTLISCFDLDEFITVEVADNGVGIASDEINRIFERFYRTAKGRAMDHNGSGLGLAIVKHILEAHNQVININSKIGSGTTFSFTLKKK